MIGSGVLFLLVTKVTSDLIRANIYLTPINKKVEKSKKRSYNNKSMKPKKQVKKKAVT